MQNNEKQKQDFVVQHLKELQFVDPKRIIEVKAFFSEAFLTHAGDDEFDDTAYRVDWLNAINYLNDISEAIAKFSATEINKQIDAAVAVLESKEVENA